MALKAGFATGASIKEFRAPKQSRARIHKLEELVKKVPPGSAEVTVVHQGTSAALDPLLVDALLVISRALDSGESVTVMVGADRQLSSQEAADLLNVSRPHVIKLARSGELPFQMVGNRHRFLRSDVLAFDQRASARRRQALADLAPVEGYTSEDF